MKSRWRKPFRNFDLSRERDFFLFLVLGITVAGLAVWVGFLDHLKDDERAPRTVRLIGTLLLANDDTPHGRAHARTGRATARIRKSL